MPVDQGPPIQVAQGPDWALPAIKGVEIRSAKFQPRALTNFEHPMQAVDGAAAIVVSLEAPVPIRAMSPVLWVGSHKLTESEVVDKSGKTMRFWALEPKKLQSGAPITMTWMNDRPPSAAGDTATAASRSAKFRYEPPK